MLEIYAVKIPDQLDDLLLTALISFVDPLKQDRIWRYVYDADKFRTLFGDLMIRSIIINKLGLKNQDISFGEHEFGKPYLIGIEDFHFNISHSREWVVVAVDSLPVGIDIEGIHPIESGVSEHVFSTSELQDLLTQPDPASYFFTLWSLKESFIKMVGTGTRFPLNEFSVKIVNPHHITIDIAGEPMDNVYLCQYNLDSKYKMGVCAHHNHFPKDVIKIPTVNLIRLFIRVEGSLLKKRQNGFLPF